jgi:hypothetical protein
MKSDCRAGAQKVKNNTGYKTAEKDAKVGIGNIKRRRPASISQSPPLINGQTIKGRYEKNPEKKAMAKVAISEDRNEPRVTYRAMMPAIKFI